MIIKAKELVDKFYNEVAKDKYPQYNKKQIITVCYTPFRYFRKAMKSAMLPIIRFKYLGEFIPTPFRAANFMKVLNRPNTNDKIPEWWRESMKKDCQTILDRAICELYDSYINERGLIRGNIDREEFNRLLKIYTNHVKKEDNIEEYNSLSTGEYTV